MNNMPHSLIPMMRWYGPDDAVSLDDIRQAGCTGVVTALHQVAIGEEWSIKLIEERREMIRKAGMEWTVVESLPVHEDIKRRSGKYDDYLAYYKVSIRNLAACGIKVITYNFMPVFDWLRSDTRFVLEDGSEALFFSHAEYAMFDLFILNRPGAHKDYSALEKDNLKRRFELLSESEKKRIASSLLQGLPGSRKAFTPAEIRAQLDKYDRINAQRLKSNLIAFLREVIPVAERAGVKLAIHPDDPPFPVFGLPRIMSTEEDIADIARAIPSLTNGLCFCTGSFGARPDNDLTSMIARWGSRIHFFHLRNTKRDDRTGDILEADHLSGDTDMYAVMKEIVGLMWLEKRNIPVRPDHGHRMLHDLKVDSYPGYSGIGRLKGLAELRGLELGVRRSMNQIEDPLHDKI